MEYEKVYVFKPEAERPAKRRRVEPQGLQTSWQRRRQAFDQVWSVQQQAIDARLDSINSHTVDKVWQFLEQATRDGPPGRIPTGIILTGADGATGSGISKQIAERIRVGKDRRSLLSLSSSSGTNLKALLKTLILKATSRRTGSSDEDGVDDEDDELRTSRSIGPKLLNYDLQLLQDHVREHRTEQVVITFEDTEAFDSDLLSEIIELLGCWQARIPFACLFNIATSIDFLQQRLSQAAVKALAGQVFDVALSSVEVEQVCEAMFDTGKPLWIGSGLMSTMLERQHDYVISVDSFVATMKYACMSHFYANALSVFLEPDAESRDVAADHVEAVRQLDSFKTYARRLLDDHQVAVLEELLESDTALRLLVRDKVAEGRQKLSAMVQTLKVIRLVQQRLPNTPVSSMSSLYVQAMSGKLIGSPLIRSLLLTHRKTPSNIVVDLLRELMSSHTEKGTPTFSGCQELLTRLDGLIESQKHSAKPLRSEDDSQNTTLRTTVVAQKVQLSKQKSALSEQDKKYTELLGILTSGIEEIFDNNLVNPNDLVFHEIFVYDLKAPYREVFTPRPRHAIERALATPHDYLDCDCCGSGQGDEHVEATLAATQPATAVLYQLYLESGSLINASDLWQAFQAVLGDGREELEIMALFQRALAELRYLGMMKSTRTRVDHVAKVMWQGL
ncbi:Origin recognition complex subunit 3 [Friedmanniomyces endolithicus]|uniref:Origin recognition complex subunit 3 n=1 Tax=Friedmanniomyces endolithicus TaxID=329885 RepID=A0AAN6QQ05_9PEZI|nr:Origin recognition complex subunit 3 [Friedmanniomyces endolithicus]KAK0964236.1 Origin recognition complex subunit 3 [Friedmanniomyces endolithicus]KAK0979154.1 Origin recognition complex subunit 3 [Friedmanniomyces endolithicus]KAK1032661.1 Origin recognition complex subunit 3 [Friedmanniomyces endolithicus]